jgi:2,3-diketo-5-methylthio-1-phosphopentane phosphatase
MTTSDLKKSTIFFDFDNTITVCDVFDAMLMSFSRDDRWQELEQKWKRGEIGSKRCLEGQLKCVDITKGSLDEFLSTIPIDPYFKKLARFFQSRGSTPIIVSDNFDYIINRVLKNNGIGGIKVYSNELEFSRDKIRVRFPFTNKGCGTCAHCKKENMLANLRRNPTAVYIGDGRSDVCPATYANVVFAKGELSRYLNERRREHIPFESLKDVYLYFTRRRS